MTIQEAFKKLEVSQGAEITKDTIKQQYRKLAHEIHPDKFQLELQKVIATKQFIKVKEAYDFLIENFDTIQVTNIYTTSSTHTDETYSDGSSSKKTKKRNYWVIFPYLFTILLIPGILVVVLVYTVLGFAYAAFDSEYRIRVSGKDILTKIFKILINILLFIFVLLMSGGLLFGLLSPIIGPLFSFDEYSIQEFISDHPYVSIILIQILICVSFLVLAILVGFIYRIFLIKKHNLGLAYREVGIDKKNKYGNDS